ncbi:hypothetical protein ACLQ20_29085 [Micromonospora sp. DT46]|uniref:hypothetical protein n=1 Tax=unclassified Micromonospora TaxID=2617518 RepID=UPI00124B8F17|nr:hypothetical protein [Micromonospora sp. AMSO12t]KAB1141490.1 hypothetical protein F6X68_21635 [Micromonospora sp. AMSO12t]
MTKRYVGLLALVAVTACLAVVGTLGGWFLAGRGDSGRADPTPSARDAATTGAVGGPSTGSPAAGASPGAGASPTKEQPAGRTYQLDRSVYSQSGLTVTLVSAATTGGKLRLNLTYRNGSPVPWPVSCPTAEVDRTSSEIVLPDGRTVRPESTWCTTTRPDESFSIAPGERVESWAVFPVVPETGSSFELTWYDFPTLDVRLR